MPWTRGGKAIQTTQYAYWKRIYAYQSNGLPVVRSMNLSICALKSYVHLVLHIEQDKQSTNGPATMRLTKKTTTTMTMLITNDFHPFNSIHMQNNSIAPEIRAMRHWNTHHTPNQTKTIPQTHIHSFTVANSKYHIERKIHSNRKLNKSIMKKVWNWSEMSV